MYNAQKYSLLTNASEMGWKGTEGIDAVNQGNWSLSIKLILECFVIVAYCKQNAKALTYSANDSKIQGCFQRQLSQIQTLDNV